MIDFSNPVTILAVFVPIIGGIIASVYYISKFIQDKNDHQTKIHVERFIEPNNNIRKIRVRYMNKIIERCNVSFNGTKLYWDGTENKTDFTIFEGSQRNASIPKNIFDENADVIIRSGKHKILHKKFNELEEATP